MKFLITLLSAAGLLASGISAAPLNERGIIRTRAPGTDYDIDDAIVDWMSDPKTKRRIKTACGTVGGWEGWAQLELEAEFREKFQIPENTDIREQSKVFEGRQIADFLLPETATHKGMIIELKCENKNAQSGDGMQKPVGSDKKKIYNVKANYKDHTFMAVAMAFTPKADKALTKVGMKPIPKAEADMGAGNTMRAYKERMEVGTLTKDMDDLEEAFKGLFGSTPPASPQARPKTPPTTGSGAPARPKTPPPTKKPTGSPPPAPKKPNGSP
ncbi:uncharacterized protein EKO05_0002029 [Ascochyta rabiei]|uniref:Uncharacterized protein n=1 Tax=Didymella rabiei TaxID=5454 RepID=A0A163LQA5_DIDRA|nr:uncharacterized protein EKO05_0002029 [Ascochyta rabiei]KZM28007.1 hypothetical protein ST47_g825 [Ascochyta rabiei]UPX11423.1 hypothetical protein EKO05_0002029 [Ascochyta rabiei]